MKSKKVVYFMFILSAFLFIGVGYAAITGLELSVGGTASISLEDEFDVKFVQVVEQSASNSNITVSASIDSDHQSSFTITGTEGYGDSAIVRYSVINNSDISSADFNIDITNSNDEYFEVESTFSNSSYNQNIVTLAPGETAILTIKAKVIKVSTDSNRTASIDVVLSAEQRWIWKKIIKLLNIKNKIY